MPLGKRQRKLLRNLVLLLAAICFILILLPLWFPWVLKPLARSQGLRYLQYERKGFARFLLHGVTFTNQTIALRADRIDALTPTVWLGRGLFKNRSQADPGLRANNWQLDFHITTSTRPASTYLQVHDALAISRTLQRWIPTALLSNGTVRLDQTLLHLPSAAWSQGKIQVALEAPQRGWSGIVSADLQQPHLSTLNLDSDSQQFHSVVQLIFERQTLRLQSTNLWRANPIYARAEFGVSGLLPRTARLQANDISLPAALLGLKGYEDLKGSISAEWQREQFTAEIKAAAHPLAGESDLPPMNLHLFAFGDTNSATLKSATLSTPWASAELSRDLRLHFSGPLLRQPAALKLSMDLSQQPWVPLTGVLNGEVEFIPGKEKFPKARFHLAGDGSASSSIKAGLVSIEGGLDWPRLKISKADASFGGASVVAAQAEFDFQEGIVPAAHLLFSGPLARRWLPEGYAYETLTLSADFHGPLKQLRHEGHLEAANVVAPWLRPLQLCCDWAGSGTHLHKIEVAASAERAVITAEGGLQFGASSFDCLLTRLQFNTNGAPRLELQKPARLVFSRSAEPLKPCLVTLDDLRLVGPAGEIQARAGFNWPLSGNLHASIQNVNSDIAAPFLTSDSPDFEIKTLNTSVVWSNGPASFELDLSASSTALEKAAPQTSASLSNLAAAPFAVDLKLLGDENGISVSNLIVSSGTSSVAAAQGFLPLTFYPNTATNRVQFNAERPLKLFATAQPHAIFWNALADWTGLSLREPELSVNVSGTWPDPIGDVHLAARQIQLRKASTQSPRFENLRMSVRLDRQQARITQFQLLLERQPVHLTAQIPLGKHFWSRLGESKLPGWEDASGRLQLEKAQVSAFTRFAPDLLAPEGRFNLDLSLAPRLKLEGTLELEGGRTRPLPNLGTIRDIEMKLKLLQQTLSLETASAAVGGALVRANGQADLRDLDWSKIQVPPFHFALRGTNVPLSRAPETIVRGDLDLAVTKTNGAPAIISGAARLRNSFYLRDLADLVPGKVSEPEHRPPYFSIPTEPLAHWRLAVQVIGDRFLTVRTPLFNGRISSNLRIQGTLQEPLALGDLKIDSGLVRFPFASLEILQGWVTLSSGDPYHPQLRISAGSKKFGYDVRMELSGPADAPLIQFSSTPPLSSEQLVLMLTAGELPKNELSLTPQQKAQTVALFFGRDFLAKLGLGDQGEERLTVRSGEEISERGTPTYTVEYKLSNRWALVGEYDRFNAFNAGFKWRVYSR